MAIKNFIAVKGLGYVTRPKMGTSNVFNGVFLTDTEEKKMAKKMKPKKSKGKK
jgi:hypothetical protein